MKVRLLAIGSTLLLLMSLSLAFAPFVYAEMFMVLARLHVSALPPPLAVLSPVSGSASGIVIDGYWRVQKIGPNSFAIGEPQDDPDNYEYLLIGASRALLIDSGSTARDIHAVLNDLTQLPVTVIPTHLHFDHTNGLRHFDSIALIDLPETRAMMQGDLAHLGRYQFMAAPDGGKSPEFKVSEWVGPDGDIDLGGRRVKLLWTPGHTATSISLYDETEKLLFTGDFIYTTSLYAFMPDSSLSAYAATADRLLSMLPADTVIYGAHCCRSDGPPQAPWLSMDDLRAVSRTVADIRTGKARSRGFLLKRYPVNALMTLITFYPFGNR